MRTRAGAFLSLQSSRVQILAFVFLIPRLLSLVGWLTFVCCLLQGSRRDNDFRCERRTRFFADGGCFISASALDERGSLVASAAFMADLTAVGTQSYRLFFFFVSTDLSNYKPFFSQRWS